MLLSVAGVLVIYATILHAPRTGGGSPPAPPSRPSSSDWRTWPRSSCCRSSSRSRRSIANHCARGSRRSPHARARASSACTSGRSARGRARPTRRWPGLGHTRRILVSDTMLEQYSDDEIEVVLAHELGHHVHHDIWRAIALESLIVVLGFFAADRALSAFGPGARPAGTGGCCGPAADRRGGRAVSLVLMPIGLALSRRHERRADRFALDLTGNPDRIPLRDAPPRRAEHGRGEPVTSRAMAVLQPPAAGRKAQGCQGMAGP